MMIGNIIALTIYYKINILKALKKKGYSTTRLRKEKILSESVIQSLRERKYISLSNVDRICSLIGCDISDLLTVNPEQKYTEESEVVGVKEDG